MRYFERNRQFSFEINLANQRLRRCPLQARHIAVSDDVSFHFGKIIEQIRIAETQIDNFFIALQNFAQKFRA